MLLGNGNLLNNLPMSFVGGAIEQTAWFCIFTQTGAGVFENTSSFPNGYGMKSFSHPIKAGGMSTVDFTDISDDVNALNVDEGVDVIQDYTMGAYASGAIGETVSLLESLSISASAYISQDDVVTVDMSAIAGALIGATLDDSIDISFSFEAGLLIGAQMDENVTITLSSSIGAFYGGEFSDSVTITCNTPIIFGSALVGYDEAVIIGGASTMIADGWMLANGNETGGILTAKEIWEYYQRTLTAIDIEVSGLTVEEHTKLLEVHKILGNDKEVKNNQLIIYADDGTTPLIVWDLKDKNGNATETSVFKSERT